MKITAKKLKDMDACAHGLRRFRRLFPNGAAPTAENLTKWVADAEGNGSGALYGLFFLGQAVLGGLGEASAYQLAREAGGNVFSDGMEAYIAALAAGLADLP